MSTATAATLFILKKRGRTERFENPASLRFRFVRLRTESAFAYQRISRSVMNGITVRLKAESAFDSSGIRNLATINL